MATQLTQTRQLAQQMSQSVISLEAPSSSPPPPQQQLQQQPPLPFQPIGDAIINKQ